MPDSPDPVETMDHASCWSKSSAEPPVLENRLSRVSVAVRCQAQSTGWVILGEDVVSNLGDGDLAFRVGLNAVDVGSNPVRHVDCVEV